MIIILSDFKDSLYDIIMKGIIKSINKDIEIISLTNITSFSIIEASFILKNSYHFFPKGTIFVCCVQPKKEKHIAIKTKDYYFIGSDNGLMYETINENKIELIIELENEKNNEQLFAKTAALLSNEFDLLKLGKITKIKNKLILKDQIVSIDNFGNIITNIKNKYKDNKTYKLKHKNKIYKIKYYDNFNKAKKNEIFLIQGTFNTIEICIKEGNANKKLKFNIGDKIELK
jgi:S-adenosyl-L-methionine hydrolase (adenosine-forming)